MAAEQLNREEKKYLAALRAQYACKKACDLIDFVEDVINPTKESFKAKRSTVEVGKLSNKEIAEYAINTNIQKEENAEVTQ